MSHHDHTQHPVPRSEAGKPHVKWILIVAVALMLVAITVYTLTMNEAVVPGRPLKQPIPAAP
jgi:hypothetical protein